MFFFYSSEPTKGRTWLKLQWLIDNTVVCSNHLLIFLNFVSLKRTKHLKVKFSKWNLKKKIHFFFLDLFFFLIFLILRRSRTVNVFQGQVFVGFFMSFFSPLLPPASDLVLTMSLPACEAPSLGLLVFLTEAGWNDSLVALSRQQVTPPGKHHLSPFFFTVQCWYSYFSFKDYKIFSRTANLFCCLSFVFFVSVLTFWKFLTQKNNTRAGSLVKRHSSWYITRVSSECLMVKENFQWICTWI